MSVFELMMIVCFGISWPFNLVKSIRARTAKGKSLIFLLAILVGYVFGLIHKVIQMRQSQVFDIVTVAYLLNFLLVAADLVVYCINRARDKGRLPA